VTRVLVTGASTPVGARLVERLATTEGVDGVLAVLPPSGTDHPGGERVQVVRADLTRERDLRSLLFGTACATGVTTVVHAAHHRSARDTGSWVHALNVESTRALLRLSERHPTINRFVLRSSTDVYEIRPARPSVLTEDHPLNLSPSAPQWVRDRVEAEVLVGMRMGMSRMSIAILRCAECFHEGSGSQLYDYLSSRICFTPLGFDPMLNLISLDDLVDALHRAVMSDAQGVFNIAGADTLPLSEVVRATGRVRVPVASPLLHPLYGLRARVTKTDFRYDQNYFRFHFSGVLNGDRAREILGYEPSHPIDWTGRAPAPRRSASA
jgi:UDP-glucose 4-epimerase